MTQTADPYDELAAMFLTQPDKPGSGGSPTDSSTIEVLVVGHLPVRAGLWLTPYADAVARTTGPIALLRLDRDEPILQILRGSEEQAIPTSGDSLREVINAVAGSTAGWVLYAGGSATPTELVRPKPDRITVLSSADDAAVVSAYQHVKNLVNAAESEQTKLPGVNLAVLGADETAANRVFDRVNRTTSAFLGVDIELSIAIQRMDAGVRSTAYMNFPGESSPGVEDVIRMIQDARQAAAAKAPAQQQAQTPQQPTQETPSPIDEDDSPRLSPEERDLLQQQTAEPQSPQTPAPAASSEQQHDGATTEPSSQAPQPETEPPLVEYVAYEQPRQAQQAQQQQQFAQAHQHRTARVVPRPQMEIEPKKHDATREPDDHGKPVPLASHIADLTPITPRCPGRERVELAVGRFGKVHLLGREDCIREMRYVETWVRDHSELLAMACPNVTIDPGAKPVSHIFTDKPASLADLQGSNVKLHVLAPVQVNGATGWYAAPLN